MDKHLCICITKISCPIEFGVMNTEVGVKDCVDNSHRCLITFGQLSSLRVDRLHELLKYFLGMDRMDGVAKDTCKDEPYHEGNWQQHCFSHFSSSPWVLVHNLLP